MLIAIALWGCNGNPKPVTSGTSNVDMVAIHEGQMKFYNYATQQLTTYEAEKDSVVNIVFDNDNHLYYTASNQQALQLKTIDLTKKDPQPEVLYDWKMTLDQITDIMYGTGASKLLLDSDGTCYIIAYNPIDQPSFDVEAYNVTSGKSEELIYSDFYERYDGDLTICQDHFYNEQRQLYYATPDGAVCLTDKIDFGDVFDKDDLEDMFFYPVSESPDGQKVVYGAVIEIGEGWGHFCVADIDGNNQLVLKDSDIWTMEPKWLADGTLAYVGDDPRCVKIMAPDGTVSVLVPEAETFYVNPADMPKLPKKIKQAELYDVDMAIIDNGKVTFYNAANNTFIPYEVEEDYVLNGVFWEEVLFYYTVAIGDELYLKKLFIDAYSPEPQMLTDWELKLSDCYDEESGITASIISYPQVPLIKMKYNLEKEFSEFVDIVYYDYDHETKSSTWPGNVVPDDEIEDPEIQLMNDMAMFSEEDVPSENEDEDDKSFYYYSPDPSGDTRICISDKINFDVFKTYYEPQFELRSVSPTRESVAYAAMMEWGHVGHGPLCFATLDGKVQMALDRTDVADVCYGWLNDGRLVYADDEGIKVVSLDGTITPISHATLFATKH